MRRWTLPTRPWHGWPSSYLARTRAVSARLAEDGFSVVVGYSGNADPAAEAVAAVEAKGGSAVAVHSDVAEPEHMRALFQSAADRFGGVDVVVNAAASVRTRASLGPGVGQCWH
jgi:NAD(P)-dependent dehydrogenase (short-subunit alcohol dehydrogenase family)